jgi:cell division control protein 6
VVLDEADILIKKSGSDLIYNLTRFDEESESPRGSISLILISQKYVLEMMDPAALSTFKRTNIIEFGKYDAKQLEGILDDRAILAFKDGVMSDGVTELIAAMAEEYGDARFAIELFERAGMIAQEKGSTTITPEHARESKSIIKPFVTREKLQGLEHHKTIVLLALARLLKKRAYTTTGDLEEMYQIICEETEQRPRGHTQVWHYLNDLEAKGIITKKKLHKGSDGTTTELTLLDMTSTDLENYLSEKVYKS